MSRGGGADSAVKALRLSEASPDDLMRAWSPSPDEVAHFEALLAEIGSAAGGADGAGGGPSAPLLLASGAGAMPQVMPAALRSSAETLYYGTDIEVFLEKRLGLASASARDCVMLFARSSLPMQTLSRADATRALRAAALSQVGFPPTARNFAHYLLCVMPREPALHGLSARAVAADLTANVPPAPLPHLSDRVLLLSAEVPGYLSIFSSLSGGGNSLSLKQAFEAVCDAYFASRVDEAHFDALFECFSDAMPGAGLPACVDPAQFAFLCNAAQFMALGLDVTDTANRMLVTRALRQIRKITLESNMSPSPRDPTSPRAPAPDSKLDEGPASILAESTSGMTEKAAAHYRRLFDECCAGRESSHVSQQQFAALFIGSLGLPIGPVRYCFHLSDLDGDNFLDLAEYAIAHHLMLEWLKGHSMPAVVPPQIVPLSKQKVAVLREIPLRRVTRVFISYRWDTPNAKGWSVLVRDALLHLGYKFVFLDIDMLSGSAGSAVASVIATCHALVPLWTKGCYDRCLGPSGASDAVRIEVETALEKKLVVVPVIDGGNDGFFSSGYNKSLPPSMMPVLGYIGSVYVHEYPEVWIRKLHRLLQGW